MELRRMSIEAGIKEIQAQAIREKIFPGSVVGVVRANGDRLVISQGNFTFEKNAQPVQEDTIYDVASLTKVIPTASLMLWLIDQGRLDLEDRVDKYIPELSMADNEKIKVWHLLTHTLAHNFQLSPHKNKTPQQILEMIYTTEFSQPPGAENFFTNATSILQGQVIEKITGRKLDQLADEVFFKPLEMKRTTFWPLKKFDKAEIVPTEVDDWRGRTIQGEVHDESAYVLQKIMTPGSAGLFSTVPDLLNFIEMLLSSGEYKGQRYLSPEIIEMIYGHERANPKEGYGLGWQLCGSSQMGQISQMGKHCGPQTFGKTGFTGSLVVCDPAKQIGFVILSNFTYPKRKDRELMNKVRRDLSNIILK